MRWRRVAATTTPASCWLSLLLGLLLSRSSVGEINTLVLDEDERTAFSIETFSFEANGRIELDVANYSLYVDDVFLSDDIQWGIMLRSVTSKSDGPAVLAVEATRMMGMCSLATALEKTPELVFLLANSSTNAHTDHRHRRELHWGFGEDHEHEMNSVRFSHNFTKKSQGRYDIEVIVCLPQSKISSKVELSAVIKTTCFNVDADGKVNYLSAGETALPVLYGTLAALFLAALGVWIYTLLSRPNNILTLHYIMLVLILFKVTSLVAYAVHLGFVASLGQTLTVVGWDVIYFAFSFLNGGAMFVLILLVGSGWSYIKPKLNRRENNMLTAVVVLQVIANVARIFVGESSPGSQGFVRWTDLLAIVDIVCCALVIFPIIWSIHKLKSNLAEVEKEERAAVLDADLGPKANVEDPNDGGGGGDDEQHTLGGGAPGELQHSLMKLKQFRHFYIVVVVYIYFTRIVVYFVDSTLPYSLAWVAPLSQELATLVFYVLSGYYFVPASDNPYLQVDDGLALEDGGAQ